MSRLQKYFTFGLTILLITVPAWVSGFTVSLPEVKVESIRIAGKNSIFDKPLGTGPGSINRALKDISDEIERGVNNLNTELKKIETDIGAELTRAKSKIDNNLTSIRETMSAGLSQADFDRNFANFESHASNDLSLTVGGLYQSVAHANNLHLAPVLAPYRGNPNVDVARALEIVDEGVTKTLADAFNAAKKAREDLGRELTKIKADLDRELTDMKKDVDSTATIAKADFSRELDKAIIDAKTEFNYFFATVCGESPAHKKLTRKHDQQEISDEEYEAEKAKLPEQRECFFGIQISDGGDAALIDKEGVAVPTPGDETPAIDDAALAHMRAVELQETIDNEVHSTLYGLADTRNGGDTFFGLGFLSTERAPANVPLTRLVMDPRKLQPPGRAAPRAHPVKFLLNTLESIAHMRNEAADREQFSRDYLQIMQELDEGETHIQMVHINGRYSGLIRSKLQHVLPINARLSSVRVQSPWYPRPSITTEAEMQRELELFRKVYENIPEKDRPASWEEVEQQFRNNVKLP